MGTRKKRRFAMWPKFCWRRKIKNKKIWPLWGSIRSTKISFYFLWGWSFSMNFHTRVKSDIRHKVSKYQGEQSFLEFCRISVTWWSGVSSLFSSSFAVTLTPSPFRSGFGFLRWNIRRPFRQKINKNEPDWLKLCTQENCLDWKWSILLKLPSNDLL